MVQAVPPVSSKKPFPENIKTSLPQPETPWQISPSLFSRIQSQTSNLAFRVCEIVSTDSEYDFILKHFEHQKPPGFGIKRIVCIHNPTHTQVFEGSLKNMEQEANNPYFLPQGRNEEPRADRAKVLYRWHQQVALFSPVMVTDSQARAEPCFNAKVLPLWHGSSETVCKSVCSSGFTSFGKHHYFDENASKGTNKSTDKGYFGSGIYFTNSAQYATMYSSEGHLLLSWVSMREPYPVINDVPLPQKGSDMRKLEGKEHYQNYNAHFVPVASIRPEDHKCIEYYPCYKDQPPAWDEFVVFHSAQILPRFWVELGVDFPKTLPLNPSEPKKEPGTGPIKIFQPSPPSAIISPLQEVCSKMGCLKMLQAHQHGVWDLSVHSNGTLISYSENDKTIKTWDTLGGKCVRTYPYSLDWPHPHFLLPNGLLLTQTRDHNNKGEAGVWNLETGKLIRTFGKFLQGIHSFNLLAPDILAIGSIGEIQIWDLSKDQCLMTLDHTNFVHALVPLPQGKFISGSYRATKLWDLSTGECIREWEGSNFILPLDSTIVATAKWYDKTIKFWDYTIGQCIKTLRGHQDMVSSLLRLQNGLLVSASNDHTIKLWDTLTGECLRTLEGHTSQVKSLALLPNETFASGSMDGTIRIWGIQPQIGSPISPPIHESPSGKNYARQPQVLDKKKEELGVDLPKTLSLNPPELKKEPVTTQIKIFQTPPPSAITSPLQEVCSKIECLKIYKSHVNAIWELSIHSNGALVSSSHNNSIHIWNTTTDTCSVSTLGSLSVDCVPPRFLLPNGNLLTQTQNRQVAAIWNLETGKLIRTFGKFVQGIYSFNLLAPNILAIGSMGEIQIWDLSKDQSLLTLNHPNFVHALAPLPQGKFISGSVQATKLWDLSTGECIRDWEGSNFILPLDSTKVATAKWGDKTIKFWDYSTGKCIKTLRGHQATVLSLLRLYSGLLVSASEDHTIKLWDTITGECVKTLEGHTSPVKTLALLSKETFASGSADGTIRIWGAQSQTVGLISPPIYESPTMKSHSEALERGKKLVERIKAKKEKQLTQNPAFSVQPVPTNATDIPVKAAPSKVEAQPSHTHMSSSKEQLKQATQTMHELNQPPVPSTETPPRSPQSSLPPGAPSDPRSIYRKPLPKPPASKKP
jgi:WD40 repeat protein